MNARDTVYRASPVKRARRTNAELDVIDDAIIAAVEAERPVSLRGVFYRVEAAGVIPKTLAAYDLIGRELLKLRRAGRVSYWDIADGTRTVFRPKTYGGIDELLADAASSYRRSLWRDSPAEVQIYSEKDAITGVVYPVTQEFDIPLGIMRGYASETFAFKVAESVKAAMDDEKETYIYQLGDHDPAGVDAWRAFTERVMEFVAEQWTNPEDWVFFQRLAVTPEQITALNLPTRPTKATNLKGFTGESIEVDAIPPTELRRIVRAAIEQHVDAEALRLLRVAEKSEREVFGRMARRDWSDFGDGEASA